MMVRNVVFPLDGAGGKRRWITLALDRGSHEHSWPSYHCSTKVSVAMAGQFSRGGVMHCTPRD